MSRVKLRKTISQFLKPARQLVLEPGEPGQIPVTKVGGVPWWPAGLERPRCSSGHLMSFIAQFRLCDVPGFGQDDPGLLSFHYCQQCAYEGHMPQGWTSPGTTWVDPDDATRYDLFIFTDWNCRLTDGLGVVAEDVETPHKVSFSDRMEAPDPGEADNIPQLSKSMNSGDYYDEVEFVEDDDDDFDEEQSPGFIHVGTSKLGGWPSWVHTAEWPRDYVNEELIFVAQLSPMGPIEETWCNGLAYLFIHPASHNDRKAKLLLQYS